MTTKLSVIVSQSEAMNLMLTNSDQVLKLINKKIKRFAFASLSSDREDIAQDIYCDLITNSGKKYNPSREVKLSTFICCVAKQHILNAAKKIKKRRKYVKNIDSLPGETNISHEMSPVQATILSEIKERMENEPDNRVRTILISRFVGDQTLSEIADTVGVSIEGVRKIIERWLSKEKKHLMVA